MITENNSADQLIVNFTKHTVHVLMLICALVPHLVVNNVDVNMNMSVFTTVSICVRIVQFKLNSNTIIQDIKILKIVSIFVAS